jgi:single-strand DNA-binding protein
MSNETPLTVTGNLVDDPELRFTPSGQPVAKFRIASTPRYFDKQANGWKDGDSLFLTVNVWRQAAENVAESMTRGTRAIVTGRLRQRSYETKEGEKRTVYELEADEVGVSLRNATAKVAKVTRTSGGEAQASRPAGGGAADPWASDKPGAGTATSRLSKRGRDQAPARASPPGGCFACQWTSWASTTRTARAIRNLAARPAGQARERSAGRARCVRP